MQQTKRSRTAGTADMTAATFTVFEIEHQGDADASVEDLRLAGCWQIEVLRLDFATETMLVRCQLPEGITDPEALPVEFTCL
jgi:hypothetical protein